jgi:hypothetical protein
MAGARSICAMLRLPGVCGAAVLLAAQGSARRFLLMASAIWLRMSALVGLRGGGLLFAQVSQRRSLRASRC